MDARTAILQRRSIRRFLPKAVPDEILTDLVDLARLHATGANSQPLRYAIISRKPMTDETFAHLKWAMFLPGFEIRKDQRPKAYIVLLRDENVSKSCGYDVGAASTNIMIAAESYGLATCCLASFSRGKLVEVLKLPPHLHPELVIAIGYPDQKSQAVPYAGSQKYYEAEDGSLQVPKHTLSEVLIFSDANQTEP